MSNAHSPGGASAEAKRPEISLVIVNFNSGHYLRECLGSIELGAGNRSYEVIVVDNASSDGSADVAGESETLRVIRNNINVGFARACNLGAAQATADLLLFINPDARLMEDALQLLADALVEYPQTAAIGPRILNPDSSVYPSARIVPGFVTASGHALLGKLWPSNPFTRAYLVTAGNPDQERTVDWLSGSALMVRASVFRLVGGFDERFFMYLEDLDLCDRIRQAGHEVRYFPAASAEHRVGGSSQSNPVTMAARHHRSAFRYWLKKANGRPIATLAPFVAIGLMTRLVVTAVFGLAKRLFENAESR